MSTDEATSPEPSQSDYDAPRKQGSLLRIILILVLVVAVIALIIDWRAQAAAQEVHDAVETLLTNAPARERPSIEAVHAEISREPSIIEEGVAPNMKVEEYRFRGGLPWRNYTVYVYYRVQPEERLYSVSLNTPEEF